MKRQRAEESLTGGTGDVSPQWMSFNATQSAADTTTTTTQAVPVQRLRQGTRAQVMEVLRVHFFFPPLPVGASATEAYDEISTYLSTTSFGTTATNYGEPRVFSGGLISQRHAFTAGGTYMSEKTPEPLHFDLTDGDGHGVLIATDSIYAQVNSVSTGSANTMRIKILYRWKNVSLQEYIGIVQSQQ